MIRFSWGFFCGAVLLTAAVVTQLSLLRPVPLYGVEYDAEPAFSADMRDC